MGSLQIDVFNPPFVITNDEDDEYLQKLLGYYKRIIERIRSRGDLTSPIQISSLAGIILCDELYKEKSKSQFSNGEASKNAGFFFDEEEGNEVERITKIMIEKIDKALR